MVLKMLNFMLRNNSLFKKLFALNYKIARECLITLYTYKYIRVSLYYSTLLDPSLSYNNNNNKQRPCGVYLEIINEANLV